MLILAELYLQRCWKRRRLQTCLAPSAASPTSRKQGWRALQLACALRRLLSPRKLPKLALPPPAPASSGNDAAAAAKKKHRRPERRRLRLLSRLIRPMLQNLPSSWRCCRRTCGSGWRISTRMRGAHAGSSGSGGSAKEPMLAWIRANAGLLHQDIVCLVQQGTPRKIADSSAASVLQSQFW